MEHPIKVFTDPSTATERLEKAMVYWLDWQTGRPNPTSPQTRDKYRKTMLSFIRSLERYSDPSDLAHLHPTTVLRWIADQRKEGRSEDGIASRLAALKAFSHRSIFKEMELSTVDLLGRAPRITPPRKQFDRLSREEMESILSAYERGTYTDIRDSTLMSVYLSTGRRFQEVIQLKLSDVNHLGEVQILAKGGSQQLAVLSPRALKALRRYLRVRASTEETGALWLTDEGRPLSYWGAMSVFRRLKSKTGIQRVRAHLLRHSFAQAALEKGVERAALQEMMGHKSPEMTRRYAGSVGQQTAARQVPRFSPIGQEVPWSSGE